MMFRCAECPTPVAIVEFVDRDVSAKGKDSGPVQESFAGEEA